MWTSSLRPSAPIMYFCAGSSEKRSHHAVPHESGVSSVHGDARDQPCGTVKEALCSDLQQHFAAVMRIFLHDSVIVSGNINVVVFVQDAAVNGGRSGLEIPERIDEIAVGVIFKDRRGRRTD